MTESESAPDIDTERGDLEEASAEFDGVKEYESTAENAEIEHKTEPQEGEFQEQQEHVDYVKQTVLEQKGGNTEDWTLEQKGDSGYNFDGKNIRDPDGNIWENEDKLLHQEMLTQWKEGVNKVFFLPDYKEITEDREILYVTTMVLGEVGNVTYEIHKHETQIPKREQEHLQEQLYSQNNAQHKEVYTEIPIMSSEVLTTPNTQEEDYFIGSSESMNFNTSAQEPESSQVEYSEYAGVENLSNIHESEPPHQVLVDLLKFDEPHVEQDNTHDSEVTLNGNFFQSATNKSEVHPTKIINTNTETKQNHEHAKLLEIQARTDTVEKKQAIEQVPTALHIHTEKSITAIVESSIPNQIKTQESELKQPEDVIENVKEEPDILVENVREQTISTTTNLPPKQSEQKLNYGHAIHKESETPHLVETTQRVAPTNEVLRAVEQSVYKTETPNDKEEGVHKQENATEVYEVSEKVKTQANSNTIQTGTSVKAGEILRALGIMPISPLMVPEANRREQTHLGSPIMPMSLGAQLTTKKPISTKQTKAKRSEQYNRNGIIMKIAA